MSQNCTEHLFLSVPSCSGSWVIAAQCSHEDAAIRLKKNKQKNMPTLDLQVKKVRQCTQLPTQLAEVTPRLSGIRMTIKFGQNDALIGLY